PGQTIERGQTAPQGQSPTHDARSRGGVGQPSQRNAGQGVDQREGGAEQADLQVAEVPFAPHRLSDDSRDGAIEEVEQIGEKQQEQHTPGVGGLDGGRGHGEGSAAVVSEGHSRSRNATAPSMRQPSGGRIGVMTAPCRNGGQVECCPPYDSFQVLSQPSPASVPAASGRYSAASQPS